MGKKGSATLSCTNGHVEYADTWLALAVASSTIAMKACLPRCTWRDAEYADGSASTRCSPGSTMARRAWVHRVLFMDTQSMLMALLALR
jgi:hypothetical protein